MLRGKKFTCGRTTPSRSTMDRLKCTPHMLQSLGRLSSSTVGPSYRPCVSFVAESFGSTLMGP